MENEPSSPHHGHTSGTAVPLVWAGPEPLFCSAPFSPPALLRREVASKQARGHLCAPCCVQASLHNVINHHFLSPVHHCCCYLGLGRLVLAVEHTQVLPGTSNPSLLGQAHCSQVCTISIRTTLPTAKIKDLLHQTYFTFSRHYSLLAQC